MGGAAGITFLLGVLRTKLAAILLGTAGVGLMAGFMAIQSLISTVAGLGIHSSAVREIAIAVGKGDEQAIGRIVLALRRVCWLTGIAGMLAMVVFSPLLSRLTFNSNEYELDIAALGLLIFLANLAGVHLAILQGKRRIADMARANIGSALCGTLSAVIFYYWLGLRGIVPSLIAIAAIQLLIARYFVQRVPVEPVTLTWRETFRESKTMVKMGLVFMWSGLMASAVSYFTIILITRMIDLEAVGLYSAAFLLSGMAVNFVLGAMGADFYPRLAAATSNNTFVNQLINEQTEIGLLLAAPALVAVFFFAPWIVQLFYSAAFMPAAELLQIFVLGSLARIVSWPLGFLMIAKGKGVLYGASETLWNFAHITLIYMGLHYSGLMGVASAFLVLNLFVILHVLYIGKKMTKFKWSPSVIKLLMAFPSVMIFSYGLEKLTDNFVKNIFGVIILLATAVWCITRLYQAMHQDPSVGIFKKFTSFK
jgi:antigen flippase